MKTIEWRRVLQSSGLFWSLDEPELERLLDDEVSYERHFNQGTLLFTEGEAGDSVYVVGTGRVEIARRAQNGRKVPLEIIAPSEMFGEMAALGRGVRSATATALEDLTLLEFSGPRFLEILVNNPKFQLQIYSLFSQRLRHADEMILTLAVNDVRDELNQLRGKVDDQSKAVDEALQASHTIFQQTKDETDQMLRSGNQQIDNLRFLTKIVTIGGVILGTVILSVAGWVGFKELPDLWEARNEVYEAREVVETEREAVETERKKIEESVKTAQTELEETRNLSNLMKALLASYVEQSYLQFAEALSTDIDADELLWQTTVRKFQKNDIDRLIMYDRLLTYIEDAMKNEKNASRSYGAVLLNIVRGFEDAQTDATIVKTHYFLLSDFVLFPEIRARVLGADESEMKKLYEVASSKFERYINGIKKTSDAETVEGAACEFLEWRKIVGARLKQPWEGEDFEKWRELNQSLDCAFEDLLREHPVLPREGSCLRDVSWQCQAQTQIHFFGETK